MAQRGFDALLVGSPVEDIFKTYGANRRYLSGFTGSTGWLLISQGEAYIAVDFRYWEQAQQEASDFTLFPAQGPIDNWFPQLVAKADLGGKRLGYEPHGITVATLSALKKALGAVPQAQRPLLVPAPPLVEELRAIKEPEELEKIAKAAELADEVFWEVVQELKPGWTEAQLAWAIEVRAREKGAEGLSFPTIVAAGPWGALPHAYPRKEKVIEEGEPIVIDMGVRVDGYCSDLTRTVVLGRADSQWREIYDIVLAAQLTAEALIRPGMRGEEAHALAHNVIAEAGYGDRFGHGLGHGLGLLVHESPRLAPRSQDLLRPGMVVTVEPGIYIPGLGGVRIEDMVVIQGEGVQVLSRAPKVLEL